MKAELGRSLLCYLAAHLLPELERQITPADFALDLEAGPDEHVAIVVRRSDEARGRRGRPWHWIRDVALGRAHDVIDGKVCLGPQHASDFGKDLCLVLNIHADMNHGRRVECAVLEG